MNYCEDCVSCERPSKTSEWYRWRCLRTQKPTKEQFVVRERWLTESPHYRCVDTNLSGECEMFEQRIEE